jgi:hypothetical protein
MEYGAILDIHVVSNPDGVYVASKDGVVPNTATVTHDDVADDGGVFSEKTLRTVLRSEAAD